MLGLNDLGIELDWKFRFLGHGESVVPQAGSVFVDIGSRIGQGIFDHHGDEFHYRSSLAVIAENPSALLNHLLGPLNETRLSGRKIEIDRITYCFNTHKNPDWGGVASFYVADHLVRHGELPHAGVVRALREATDAIDQGRVKVSGKTNRPFLIYLMIMHGSRTWAEQILEGEAIIRHVLEQKAPEEIGAGDFLDEMEVPARWEEEAQQLGRDYELFLRDMEASSQESLFLPRFNDSAEESTLLRFDTPTQCRLFKYWAREIVRPGATMVPFADAARGGRINRVIISTDPATDYSLPLLGYELERRESEKRKKLGRERTGSPRFEPEYCDNSDPWYDGRGHEFTIVDSPQCGTELDYGEIVDTMRALYVRPLTHTPGKTGIDAFISYRRVGGSELAWTLQTILTKQYGKTVFLDVENLKNGRFDTQLKGNLEISRNLVLILSPGSLDRCTNPGDWVRQEIMTAFELNKNIIPVMTAGFDFDSFGNLPEDIARLAGQNGVLLKHEYFQEGIRKIVDFMQG